jgi:hypothetical protein
MGMIAPVFVVGLLSSLLGQIAMIEVLPFQGSTLSLLVIAGIAVVVLAIFRLLIPLIIVGVVVIVLVVLIFGGIPVPS